MHTDSCDHGREQTDSEEDNQSEPDSGNEFVFAKVLAQRD
jgi:hypothetical protein